MEKPVCLIGMELFDFIAIPRTSPALDFLVIGGFAVAAHGHSRATFDVIFWCDAQKRDLWKSRFQPTGLQLQAETSSFIQFSSSDDGSPLDLMLVDNPTF